MYPFLRLGSIEISLTGLAIVSFLVVFILIVKQRCQHSGLQFRQILRFLPLMLLLGYVLGTRTWYAVTDLVFFPLQPQRWLLYLSPHEYHFHFSGIVLGISIGWAKFLKSQPWEKHFQRRTILFEGIVIASIPFGIFLLFGDNFLGKAIESGWYVSAIDPMSKMAAYDKLIPLGLYLSTGSGILYLLISFLHHNKPRLDRIFVGYILYILLRGTLMLWQMYPRHIVIKLFGLSWDIKQYTCILLCGVIGYQWYLFRTSSTTSLLHETHSQR